VGVELARLPEQTARAASLRATALVVHGASVESADPVAVNGVLPHLHARHLTMLYVSRAPLEKLQEER
jgi:hypothetical protein